MAESLHFFGCMAHVSSKCVRYLFSSTLFIGESQLAVCDSLVYVSFSSARLKREGRGKGGGGGGEGLIIPVDHHDHSRLAVVCLRTVQIHGLRARHGHVEGAHHAAGAAIEGDEAAVNAFTGDGRLTRCGGVALRHGVVSGGELELDHVARLRGYRVGREREGVAADEHRDQARG